MTETHSKCYSFERQAFIVKHYFHSNLYQTTIQLYKRPHALTDDNKTKLTGHMDKNPGMSTHHIAQELDRKCKTVSTTLKKKKGYFSYQISVLHELKPED